jgi:hypothetical protein
MKLLTRKQIIQSWQQQPEEYLDRFCCPHCRDILTRRGNFLYCDNIQCTGDDERYTLAGIPDLQEDEVSEIEEVCRRR